MNHPILNEKKVYNVLTVFVSVYDVASERDSMMRMMYIGKF